MHRIERTAFGKENCSPPPPPPGAASFAFSFFFPSSDSFFSAFFSLFLPSYKRNGSDRCVSVGLFGLVWFGLVARDREGGHVGVAAVNAGLRIGKQNVT
jgi:hypothetical protein